MPRIDSLRALLCLVLVVGSTSTVRATQEGRVAAASTSPASPSWSRELEGFPIPQLPATIARDESGRTTVRAVPLTMPLRIDGVLDEAIYERAIPISDFIQNDPAVGAPSTEKTEVWILFDRDNVYVTARCWDTQPDQIIANEMRRDSFNIVQSNDGFGFAFDTFHDRRNSVAFEVSAAGGRLDAQITGERQVNVDWNPVWNAKVGRFAQGWTMEAAIPFKSLRYRAGRDQVWGFNSRRVIRRKNESTYMVPLPASMTLRGHFVASLMPTLIGIEAPAGSRNLELKPYVISQLTTDRLATPRVSNDPGGNLGFDAKVGITDGLTSDFTYRTDFAQVEADEQQVNLTRFSLFFPEKRDFFLENQGITGPSTAARRRRSPGRAAASSSLFSSRSNLGSPSIAWSCWRAPSRIVCSARVRPTR